jgi:hypothetical protein
MDSVIRGGITPGNILLCTAVSLVLGLLVSGAHMAKNRCSKNFAVTLALLPAIVQIVMMMVNGNIGTGVAVAGAFSLVRFRSVPGGARDIGSIFFAMAIGLAAGTGYLFYAALFTVIIGAAQLLLLAAPFGEGGQNTRILKITVPENLDYEGIFDDIFAEYAENAELDEVKTTNLGSLFELTYHLRLRHGVTSKAFIDALRCRNGNLNISLLRQRMAKDEL